LDQSEATLIAQALKYCNGNKSEAARLLGIRPNTLHYKLERFGLAVTKTTASDQDDLP
jgi:DNA-binding NtrC family response regulator